MIGSIKRAACAFLLSSMLLSSIPANAQDASKKTPGAIVNFTRPRTAKQWMTATAVGLFVAGWIRLKAHKGNAKKWDYKWSVSEFASDFVDALQVWNVFSSEDKMNLFKFIDKYVIGREFSLVQIKKKRQLEDGSWETIIDRIPKSRPFGLIGCTDSYIFYFLEKLDKNFSNLAKVVDHFNINTGLTVATSDPAPAK